MRHKPSAFKALCSPPFKWRGLLLHMMLALALLASCTGGEQKPAAARKRATAKAQSAPYEMLIVADKDWLRTAAGEAFVEAVNPPIEGLPQIEPCFRVTSVAPSAFSATFRTYSKIVRVDIDRKHAKPSCEMQSDVYCRPQTIATFKAASDAELAALLERTAAKVVSHFNEQELARERTLLARHHSGAVQKAAREMFGISINAPQDIDDVKRGRDFLWASASKQEFRLNVCIYTVPLASGGSLDFTAVRDSVMKANIPGGRDDQWMETDARTVTSAPRGDGSCVVRGLWSMRHDAMGGPFVCYAMPDTASHRWLIAEGFAFAPEEKKRPIIRELEAMLQTIE